MVFNSVSAFSLVPAKLLAVTAKARAWNHSAVFCAPLTGVASAGKATFVKMDSAVTVCGSFDRKRRKALLSSVSHGMPYCACDCGSGSLSSSKAQWCFGVVNDKLVSSAPTSNFGFVASQFFNVIRRMVGFTSAVFPVIFGMASVDVDQRQMEVGYLVLAAQLKEEHDLVYALDLFDRIDLCRKKRDLSFSNGLVAEFRAWEKSRNEHITTLAKLLERKGR